MHQFNFVGRLLGPRGNSLKRVEATTGCRVYIRGKGSIKDPDKVMKTTIIFQVLFANCLKSMVHPWMICILIHTFINWDYYWFFNLKEEKLRGRPGYEHLNEPLHILIEAELPANVVDIRLRQAQEIIEELLKPVVCSSPYIFLCYAGCTSCCSTSLFWTENIQRQLNIKMHLIFTVLNL